MQQNMDARCDDTPDAERQRAAIREAIASKVYEFDAHGVEMNHRYSSNAVVKDGQAEPAFTEDSELHFQPTSWPGARLPHVWLFGPAGEKVSTLDLTGHGIFTVLTGIGGDGWIAAAKVVSKELGVQIAVHKIGPRQTWQDLTGDWARARDIRDSGALLVRPDHHVAWRADAAAADPTAELRRVFQQILDR
jgi:2,4-dichlorophenol 6-monooxygenase